MVSSPTFISNLGPNLTSIDTNGNTEPKLSSKSSNGRTQLVILNQPEEQHRARYLTEGSRGAIKDVSGMGHPIVKLMGYNGRAPLKLECYIGHDKNNGAPHLFYQASKISGKNSTQCTACKVNGTSVIVMNLLPEHDMQVTIDCVGILKERNVDVEQKLQNLNRLNELNGQTFASAFNSIAQIGQQQQQQQQQHQQQQQQQQQHHHHHHHQSQVGLAQHQHQQITNQVPQHIHQIHLPQLHHQTSSLLNGSNHLPLIANSISSRRDSSFLHADENSVGSTSQLESIFDDCSNDVSRHSMINVDPSPLCNISSTNTNSGLSDNPVLVRNGSILTLNSRKRSVRCRLVFRVKLPETGEILQVTSTPIICTQPLGTPEICKKSIDRISINASDTEMFIIGKNFLKDSKVIFQSKKNDWIKEVEIDKEFFNSSHLICKVPNYDGPEISHQTDIIEAEIQVRSGGKFSESHSFTYINDRGGRVSIDSNTSIASSKSSVLSVNCSHSTGLSTPDSGSTNNGLIVQHPKIEVCIPQAIETKFDPSAHQNHTTQLTSANLSMNDSQQHQQIQAQYHTSESQTQPFESQQQQPQQQQPQQHVLQGQQIQRQIIIQQAPSQPQLISPVDLSDDATVVYTEPMQAQSALVHSVIQSNANIMGTGNMNQIEQVGILNGHLNRTQQIHLVDQQLQSQQAPGQQAQQQAQQQSQQQALQYQPAIGSSTGEQSPQFNSQQHQHQQEQQSCQQTIQHLTIQQQQLQSHQILTNSDLTNDETTVIYVQDSLQAQTGQMTSHNVAQNSSMSSLDLLNEDTCMSVTANNTINYYSGPILG